METCDAHTRIRVREKYHKEKLKDMLRKTKNAQIWHISTWVRYWYQNRSDARKMAVMSFKRVKGFNINLC